MGLAVVVGLLVALLLSFGLILMAVESLGGPPVLNSPEEEFWTRPFGVLLNNLSLAMLIPVSMAGVWAGHRWSPRWLASVVGGIRWGWMAWCLAVTVAVSVPATVVFGALDGGMRWAPEDQALWLLLVILLTTPLQAAGEEYLFRGWMLQGVGSLIPRALPAVLVSGTLSSVLFALAHGEQNVWLFVDRFVFAAVAVLLVHATGGLEAAVALHTVNNLSVMIVSVATGTFAAPLETTEADLLIVAVDVVLLVVIAALLVGLARWRRVCGVFQPPPAPVLPSTPPMP